MSELYIFLQRTRSWYGAVELVQNYRRNMRRGLTVSLVVHTILIGVYWAFFYTKPPENQTHEVRITTYEELAVVPTIGQSEYGLKVFSIIAQATESGDEKPDQKAPP